jgi:polar amino acid transport system permease protein/polar amino acid transport system substrate-binding protein
MKKQLKKRLLVIAITVAVCLGAIAAVVIIDRQAGRSELTLTEEQAQEYIEAALDTLPLQVSKGAVYVESHCTVQVLSVEYGYEKNVIARVAYETPDVKNMYAERKQQIFEEVWNYYKERTDKGRKVGATNILALLNGKVEGWIKEQPMLTGELDVTLYDMGAGKAPQVYLTYETVNALMGGFLEVRDDVKATEVITVNGEEISIKTNNSIRNGISDCFGLNNYESEKPDVSTPLVKAWNGFKNEFYRNFIQDNRWTYLVSGFGNTLAITGLALVLGIVVGFFTAIIRCVNDKTGKLKILSKIGEIYVAIIRGTPLMVQLLIIYFVLLLPIGIEKFPAAILCFGLNSGAYVSEIVRGGIMSVDGGQMEAGRSLGFGYGPTMFYVVLPQAFKAVLPALCNEFITLFKETSIAFYIGVADLMQGGLKIRSITYSNFMPLIAVALIYLVVVVILTKLVGLLERRLRRSER